MKLIVGLGNPGAEYSRHRHNIGFMAADAIASRHRLGPWRRKFRGEIVEGDLAGEKVVLLKPQTFMNESGRSVAEAVRFYKLALAEVIVLHDELDLAAGKVRVKLDGGVAGHNGLRSLAACLGGRDFWRVRIGIGHPGERERVLGHVLGDFHKADQPWVDELVSTIADAIGLLVAGDDGRFMNKVALATAPKPGKGDAAA
jgi:PTH1 family peptidyl-tRNA hydrolase